MDDDAGGTEWLRLDFDFLDEKPVYHLSIQSSPQGEYLYLTRLGVSYGVRLARFEDAAAAEDFADYMESIHRSLVAKMLDAGWKAPDYVEKLKNDRNDT